MKNKILLAFLLGIAVIVWKQAGQSEKTGALNFPAKAVASPQTILKEKPQLPPAPTREELAGTNLELSVSKDGHYQIGPKGDAFVEHDRLVAAPPEVWATHEENWLQEINGDNVELSPADQAFIAAWRKSLSNR